MNTREIKVWNHVWNMEVTEYVRSIDGVDLQDAHVQTLKEDLYTFISDASKDATGRRMRYDISDMSVAQLEELAASWSDQACAAIEREEKEQRAAEARFEEKVANLIECGAGDRATAIRWIRDAQDDFDRAYGDDYLKFKFNLSYTYDLDHGDHDYYKRQAAKAA